MNFKRINKVIWHLIRILVVLKLAIKRKDVLQKKKV